jgi:hypothetical protein
MTKNIHTIFSFIVLTTLLSCVSPTNQPTHYTDTFKFKDKNDKENFFYAFKNLDSALYWATIDKKPILIIFSGYACMAVPNQEWKTLSAYGDNKKIQDNFIIAWLAVDDKQNAIDTTKTVFWRGKDRKLITIGDQNKYYEETVFNISTQPLFWFIDSLKIPFGKTLGYTPIKEDVEAFINSGLTWNKNADSIYKNIQIDLTAPPPIKEPPVPPTPPKPNK